MEALAEDLYRRLLDAEPNHAECNHQFGLLKLEARDLAAAGAYPPRY